MKTNEIHIGKHYKSKDGKVFKIDAIYASSVVHAIDSDGKEHLNSLTQFAEWAESEVVET